MVGAFLSLLCTIGISFAKVIFVIDYIQPLWSAITINFWFRGDVENVPLVLVG
jgi:hypothetical protein